MPAAVVWLEVGNAENTIGGGSPGTVYNQPDDPGSFPCTVADGTYSAHDRTVYYIPRPP